MSELTIKGEKAKKSSYKLSYISTEAKNNALHLIADLLLEREKAILEANAFDIDRKSVV
jgi:gamma-glutamyl phosphate reductase